MDVTKAGTLLEIMDVSFTRLQRPYKECILGVVVFIEFILSR